MKPNFWNMWMLLDCEDWQRVNRYNDGVAHKTYDIWFYIEQYGVRYRNSNFQVVYEPNILGYFLLQFRIAKIRKLLFKVTIEKRK